MDVFDTDPMNSRAEVITRLLDELPFLDCRRVLQQVELNVAKGLRFDIASPADLAAVPPGESCIDAIVEFARDYAVARTAISSDPSGSPRSEALPGSPHP